MVSFFEKTFWWLPFGSVPEMTALELNRKLANKKTRPQLIDVRTPGEWNQGHIARTLNVPVSVLRAQISALPFDEDQPTVVVCRTATRSIPAVRLLRIAGYKNVSQLKGGMVSWESKRYAVKKNG